MTEQHVAESKQRSATLAPVLLVLGLVALLAFHAGSRSRVVTEEVSCLSAEGVIGCTLADGWDVSVPLDISWTDSQGDFHEDGRPGCLPPTGRGPEGPVRVSWAEMEAEGTGWRQVVHVECLD